MGRLVRFAAPLLLGVLPLLLAACRGRDDSPSEAGTDPSSLTASAPPCAVALVPQIGTTPLDAAIDSLQVEARNAPNPAHTLERLGWTFVEKARLSYDPGYYKLAEQTALCIESRLPHDPAALLLRGHVLHNLHRFREMEAIARGLVDRRGGWFDYALLGDALMEQGRLADAAPAYQKMVDLKPNLQSYSRVAHMRWLKGDLQGAIVLMRMATHAGSLRDREALAWAHTRLALYELQAGEGPAARRDTGAALELAKDYAPALLARGHMLMAEGRSAEAVEPLARAAALNPLPEYQWALAEALRAAGRAGEARAPETRLAERGAADDPRTYALYLATRGDQVDTAVCLAREELGRRQDVLTLDALAWSLAAAGRLAEGRPYMARAVAEGTQDARLFLHVGILAGMAGEEAESRLWLQKAAKIRQMLLPSERDRLTERLAALKEGGTAHGGAPPVGRPTATLGGEEYVHD